jgi:hypothetical protein
MDGVITRVWAGVCAVGLLAAAGCNGRYHDLVDPCYPERYGYMAREAVNGSMAPQVQNGHVLDQTVWNHHFEAGSDRLTPGGHEQLKYIARRRPHADPMVYVQTAQDVAYDAAAPDKNVRDRENLDNRRVQAVQAFLGAYTAGTRQEFRVVVHDPSEVGQFGARSARAIQLLNNAPAGSLPMTGASVGGGGGSSGGGR